MEEGRGGDQCGGPHRLLPLLRSRPRSQNAEVLGVRLEVGAQTSYMSMWRSIRIVFFPGPATDCGL
jgi:hypothetical protein